MWENAQKFDFAARILMPTVGDWNTFGNGYNLMLLFKIRWDFPIDFYSICPLSIR